MYSQASHSAASKRSAQPQRSYTRMASVAAPPSAGPSPSKATVAGSSWDDDHGAPQSSSCGTMLLRCLLLVAAKTQLLLKEHNRFLEQLKQRPARREPQYSVSHAQGTPATDCCPF